MRVIFDRETPAFESILGDPCFNTLMELCAKKQVVRIFVSTVVMRSKGRPPSYTFVEYANLWSATRDPIAPAGMRLVLEAAESADRLWDVHADRDNGGNLRGAIIEGLVRQRLKRRYQTGMFDDNVKVTVKNNSSYISKSTIDVAGWDGRVGECHDCKAQPLNLKKALVDDMESGLPPCFKIGIVTARSAGFTSVALRQLGIQPSKRTRVITLERLWDMAPLQAVAA